jgi:dUTP pyrophosphatase
MQVNGVGIIDNDYCGEDDTLKFGYINMTKETQFVEKGTRIGQGVFVKVGIAEFDVVEKM